MSHDMASAFRKLGLQLAHNCFCLLSEQYSRDDTLEAQC